MSRRRGDWLANGAWVPYGLDTAVAGVWQEWAIYAVSYDTIRSQQPTAVRQAVMLCSSLCSAEGAEDHLRGGRHLLSSSL